MEEKWDQFPRVKRDPEVRALVGAADDRLRAIGLNEHGFRHVCLVADTASRLLRELGFDGHVQDQARIAGLLHDIGNAIAREHHASTGACLADSILSRLDVPHGDIAVVIGAIASHGDDHGSPGIATDAVSAALILADKSDVHRSRVWGRDTSYMDRHDLVGFSVLSSWIRADRRSGSIRWDLEQDSAIATEREFLNLFAEQLRMCEQAARCLGCSFRIVLSGVACE